jgi:hypothetical protein
MKSFHTFPYLISAILLVSTVNCISTENRKVSDANLQLQKSTLLSTTRYISVYKAIKGYKNLEPTQKDLDWWIDLSILELVTLENLYPDFDWGNVDMDSSVALKAKRFYREIADYRIAQPRLHDVPMKESEIEAIKKFTEKYKSAEQGAAANP